MSASNDVCGFFTVQKTVAAIAGSDLGEFAGVCFHWAISIMCEDTLTVLTKFRDANEFQGIDKELTHVSGILQATGRLSSKI